MKKILLLSISVVFGLLNAKAQDEPIEISAGNLTRIHFASNMKVVIKQVQGASAELKFNKPATEKLKVEISGDDLHISARKPLYNQTVYVLVNKVQALTVGSHSSLNTQGILHARNIDLYVEDGANARLLTSAKVNTFPVGDYTVIRTNQ